MTFTPFFVALHATDDLEERKKIGYTFSTLNVGEHKLTLFKNKVEASTVNHATYIANSSQTSFKMVQNAEGEWLLRVFRKSPKSPFKDSSLNLMDRSWLVQQTAPGPNIASRFQEELEKMVQRADPELMKLKEYSNNWYAGHTFEVMLAFPFLRNYALEISPSRPPVDNVLGYASNVQHLGPTLKALKSEGIPLYRGLRQASSLTDFLDIISKNNKALFRSPTDYESMCRVNSTWLFLTWRLGVPAEFLNTMMHKPNDPKTRSISFPRTYIDQFKVVLKHFNSDEILLIKNMFRYLPSNMERSIAFTAIVTKELPYPYKKYAFTNYQAEADWRKIPIKKRSELARELFRVLTDDHSEDYRLFEGGLVQLFAHWFAKNVTPQLLLSSFSKYQELQSIFAEKFEIDIAKSEAFEISNTNGISFLTKNFSGIRMKLSSRPLLLNYNFFKLLHDDEKNSYEQISGVLVSEVLEDVKKKVVVIDTQLAKLGREVTPENRCLFLQAPSYLSKYKNFWRYVDYGVRDYNRILALKKVKAGKKASLSFNELPDDMFYEFVLDMSMEEFRENFATHSGIYPEDVQLSQNIAFINPTQHGGIPF